MEIINHPIKPRKGKAWHFKIHPYFTKQAHNVVNAYIKHFSNESDLILDPFGGTGVTAIEAITLRRKVIIIDINPLACFLIKQTCKKIDINKFIGDFANLEKRVKKEIESYYKYSNNKVNKIPIEYWYPKNIKLPNNSDFIYVENLFTKRQLLSYSLILHEIKKIKNKDIQEMMKFVFSSTLSKVNLTYMDNKNRGPEGGGSSVFGKYRYWRPKQEKELNVWKNFCNKFKYIYNAKKKWNDITYNIDVDKYLNVIQGSALELTDIIENNSIDYIYTDPPYGGNITYLDLSTMWNTWLSFPVSEEMRKDEIIEGGDLSKTQDEYEVLLAKSFKQMARVLKKNSWLSCVFAHKKLEFWNVILDSCEDNGMEFKGSVYQPTNNTSIHYKMNPANVLCSQRIASFRKTFTKSIRNRPDNLQTFILNEMERACIENQGASIDTIYQRVLDNLLHNKTIGEAKKKGYLKLHKILDDDSLFEYNPDTDLYYVKQRNDDHIRHEKEYFKHKDQMRIYLKDLLNSHRALTRDEIQKEIFDIFREEKRFPIDKNLDVILSEIARKSPKSGKWQLIKDLGEQEKLGLDSILTNKLIKVRSDGHSHSEIIFRLVMIGNYLKYSSWIGKREQSIDSFQGQKFSDLSISKFPLKDIANKEKIQQIDVIWFDKNGNPRYAFEVEESTSILSGLERFKHLLDEKHDISKNLFIVCPKSRRKKLADVFKTSTYVGHPLYMENKVKFIFKEDLKSFYDKYVDIDFKETDLKIIYNDVKIS